MSLPHLAGRRIKLRWLDPSDDLSRTIAFRDVTDDR